MSCVVCYFSDYRKALGDEMKLKWALVELKKNGREPVHLSGQIDLSKELKHRYAELIDISLIDIDGYLLLENDEQVLVSLLLNYQMTLPSTRSLKPVVVEMNESMTEIYLSPHATKPATEDELVFRLEYDWLDLKEPIIETILTSMPLQVLTNEEQQGIEEMPSGEGWQVLSSDDYQDKHMDNQMDQDKEKNSPFSILKDYFENDEKDQ